MPICSRAVLKQDYLNIPASDNSLDKTFDRWITIAENEIEDICGQSIVAKQCTYYVRGTTDHLLWLGLTVPMTLVSVASRANMTEDFAPITGTASVVSVDGVQHLATTGTWTAAEYRIVATTGYATVPNVIELCAYELVTELYFASAFAPGGSRFGVSAITDSAGGVSVSKTITSARAKIEPRLRPYRRIVI
jgi:hypothetical protein